MKRLLKWVIAYSLSDYYYHRDCMRYVDRFFKYSRKYGNSLSTFKFRDLRIDRFACEYIDSSAIEEAGDFVDTCSARCFNFADHAYIEVNRLWWFFASDIQKEMVIFHELGHALFFLKDEDRLVEIKGCLLPSSLMYYTIDCDEYQNKYKKCKDYYLKKLFLSDPTKTEEYKFFKKLSVSAKKWRKENNIKYFRDSQILKEVL